MGGCGVLQLGDVVDTYLCLLELSDFQISGIPHARHMTEASDASPPLHQECAEVIDLEGQSLDAFNGLFSSPAPHLQALNINLRLD